jgi:hypothetical protein
VDASRSQIQGCDCGRVAQGDEELVQGQDVVWSQDIRTVARDEDVEFVADPVRELLESVAGDVGSWRRGGLHCGAVSCLV